MATIFNNISPNGENRRLMLIDAWAEDPLTVDMMNHPVNGDKVAVRSHNSLNEIVVDSVKVYDNGSWVDEGGGSVNPSPTPSGTKIYEGSISTTMTEDGYAASALDSMLVTIPDADLPATVTVEFKSNTYTLNLDTDKLADQGIAQYGEFDAVTGDPVFTNIPIALSLSEGESPETREHIMFMTAAAETDEAVVVTGEIGE